MYERGQQSCSGVGGRFFVFCVKSNMGTVGIVLIRAVCTQSPLSNRKAVILEERYDGIGFF